jgi:hypothetical protein
MAGDTPKVSGAFHAARVATPLSRGIQQSATSSVIFVGAVMVVTVMTSETGTSEAVAKFVKAACFCAEQLPDAPGLSGSGVQRTSDEQPVRTSYVSLLQVRMSESALRECCGYVFVLRSSQRLWRRPLMTKVQWCLNATWEPSLSLTQL